MGKDKKPSLSVVIPALNEEGNLENTVRAVYQAMDQRFSAYEILIFNDGSADTTGRIAETLATKDSNVKVIHNPRTMGFGYNIRAGIERARHEYVTMVPGDNEIPAGSIEQLFKHTGPADIVVSYFTNQEIRPFHRQIVSRLYTTALNLIFGLDMKYYNGPFVYRCTAVQRIPVTTGGFAYLASNLIRMLKMGHSFIEVGIPLEERKHGSSKAITVFNSIVVAKTIFLLFLEIYVWERGKFRNKPRRIVGQLT
ncbi:MAG TPA: glycosyltransferase family 2 protein [Candidatus Tripitaka californicus]|uniref:glycosyltransferase family 2 protein n=1 Tax=Candidatus Tripitaka californicus TaxID=3367616 RepID=UPI00402517E6